MPSFEFCYINADGSLACTLAACCADEKQARALVNATKLSEHKHYEVWLGERLVYEQRPESAGELIDKARDFWVTV